MLTTTRARSRSAEIADFQFTHATKTSPHRLAAAGSSGPAGGTSALAAATPGAALAHPGTTGSEAFGRTTVWLLLVLLLPVEASMAPSALVALLVAASAAFAPLDGAFGHVQPAQWMCGLPG